MADQNWNSAEICINIPSPSQQSPIGQKLRLHFSKKIGRILISANILLLVATHLCQSFDNDANLFEGHGTIKWIYYGCEILCALAYLIVGMELSSSQLFWNVKILFGSLGFEFMLWMTVCHDLWILINVCIVALAIVCAAGWQLLDVLREIIQPLDDDPFSEVHFDTRGNIPTRTIQIEITRT
ncbi:hypothetical protein CRG98_028002 [Punica granatum]|uniref:Uncharacterized protein n=1 Tax=Punica granatum TaxID=22663 RepID=A0A2I0J5R5_PUNGR|nr:hypothetical protein CRG98_028002 [Punica granatum]